MLRADRWAPSVYLLVLAGAVARLAAALIPFAYLPLLAAAGIFWPTARGSADAAHAVHGDCHLG